MKIIVMMKQVANKDAILRINKDATWIEEGDLSFEVSESDGYALEEALRVREKLGGEVIVCSMGPQRVKSVIKTHSHEAPIGRFTLLATTSHISHPTRQRVCSPMLFAMKSRIS